MNKILTATSIALTNMFIGHAAMADDFDGYTVPSCLDDQGQAVMYYREDDPRIDSTSMVMYAGARYLDRDTISQPAILYDTDFIKDMTPVMFDFTMAHECFHLTSGDARHGYEQFLAKVKTPENEQVRLENRANCDAAHDLREVYNYKPEDVDVLEDELRERLGNRHARDFMPLIRSCFANDTPRP